MMSKKMMKSTDSALIAKPAFPIQKGPCGTFLRPVRRWGRMAQA